MDNKIYNIEDYKRLLKLKEDYEQDLIDEDDMTLEEINSLIKLYKYQIRKIGERVKKKLLIKRSGDLND